MLLGCALLLGCSDLLAGSGGLCCFARGCWLPLAAVLLASVGLLGRRVVELCAAVQRVSAVALAVASLSPLLSAALFRRCCLVGSAALSATTISSMASFEGLDG